MVGINLMPWRARRQRRQWQRCQWLLGLMLVLIILAMLSGYWQQRLNQQREAFLSFWPGTQQNVMALHERTLAAQKRLELLRQVQRQQQLQQQELAQWLAFIEQLSEEIPPAIWLNGLKKGPQGISLKGFSRSIAELHQLRDRLHQQRDKPTVKLGALRRESLANVSFSMQLSAGNREVGNE